MAAPRGRPGLSRLTGLGFTALALAASGLAQSGVAEAVGREAVPSASGIRHVDPFVGTDGTPPWFAGHTTPAAALPFGMVQLGPDTTADGETGAPSAYPSGYGHRDPLVRGFSPTHLSGAGCRAFGDVPVLPITGRVPADPGGATVPIDHATERASPGRYAVTLGNGVRIRLAAAERAGLASFTFPTGRRATLLVKASGSLAGTDRAEVRLTRRGEVVVTADSGHFCGRDSTYRVHVVLRFDQAPRRHGVWGEVRREGRAAVGGPGDSTGLWLDFGRHAGRVRAQVGVSFVSPAGARRNLEDADLGWSLSRLADRAASVWATELDRVWVEGGTAEEIRTFSTALYHSLLHPTVVSDADGRYPGFDGRVHRLPAGRRHYSAVSGWDVYRTQIPLLAWLRPDVASGVVRSLHRAARQGGRYPRWPLVAEDTGVMGGDAAAPLVAAAAAFGARDFPLGKVAAGLLHQARTSRPGLADYLEKGYVPTPSGAGPHGASVTLEYAAADFALSRLARRAGDDAAAEEMRRRSGAWRSLLDRERRTLAPRSADGSFPGPQWTLTSGQGFEEGNAAQYTWMVPHDQAGLLADLGTRQEVIARLDDFHARLDAGAGAAHAWLGNQPSFATPWAYLWLGAPHRTQDVVRRARAELWSPTPGGLPGNEDLGALSAWYVWTSLGLYPLTPGTAHVGIGTPAFDAAVVRPSSGRTTRITRRGAGAHVEAVAVDGRPRPATWLDLAPESRPRQVVVTTTDDEEPGWGTGATDAPPSYPAG